MNSRSAVTVFLLLGLGFGLGWWSRDATETPEAAPPPAAVAQPEPRETRSHSIGSNRLIWKSEPSPPEDAETAAPEQVEAGSDLATEDSAQESFRRLLDEGRFRDAMQIYAQVDRRDPAQAAKLKAVVMGHLQRSLQLRDDRALTGLIDAFLAYDYDDLDVLLLLARHHQEAGYPLEAARTYQLALTYTYEPRERGRVEQAFTAFVTTLDGSLAGEERWQELRIFYENLARLDLQWPGFQMRLAEIYLKLGQSLLARQILTPLTRHPTLGQRASALLAEEEIRPAVASLGAQASQIPLGRLGGHFHLPMQVGGMPLRLVIDTGASTTTLSREAFDALSRGSDFTPLPPQMFNTANGPVRGEMYRVERVQLGEFQLSGVEIAVLDLQMPQDVDGLLGMNILRHFRFQLDQEREVLSLQAR